MTPPRIKLGAVRPLECKGPTQARQRRLQARRQHGVHIWSLVYAVISNVVRG